MSLPRLSLNRPQSASPRVGAWVRRRLAWLVIFGFFLFFAGPGVHAGFTRDDLMNLHNYLQEGALGVLKGNVCYWSSSYRPLGGVFYLSLYKLFGFNPLPFRLACFSLLIANLLLAYRFVVTLSASRETALLAALLLSYHAWFVDLYYSSGTIYELLCFFFYFAAFLLYISLTSEKPPFSVWRCLAVPGLYICALNAKEMAVTLPLFILIYELVYRPPQLRWPALRRWVFATTSTIGILVLITVPYVVVKLTGQHSLTENPAYRLQVSPGRFLDAFHLYLNPLLYQEHVFRDSNTIQLLIGMLALAVLCRSRAMIFGWLFLLLSPLPFLFVPHYVAMFLYIPSVGWAQFIASALVYFRGFLDGLAGRVPGWKSISIPPVSAVAMFLILAVALAVVHGGESPKTLENFTSHQPDVRTMARALLELRPELPKGSRVLFLDDPFPVGDDWSLLFLVRLVFNDLTLEVGRAQPDALPVAQGKYDLVLTYRDQRLLVVPDNHEQSSVRSREMNKDPPPPSGNAPCPPPDANVRPLGRKANVNNCDETFRAFWANFVEPPPGDRIRYEFRPAGGPRLGG